ncbi:hypothetical protein SLS55_005063 [Diplodia seriata]|uniref:Phosphatidylcholine-sterol O-acyltransferase-like protein n=1 Tax=Diplodia seriata TaxID=420778 RepID=A0ABR3CFB0_9PEZI
MPNSLHDARFRDINHSDLSTPSDDDSADPHDFPSHDAQSLVGVSLGHAQTHFTSPTTPAAEKAAAMDDLMEPPFGDTSQYGLEGAGDAKLGDSTGTSTPTVHSSQALQSPRESPPEPATPRLDASPQRMPSPWRSGPKVFQRSDDLRQSLRESFAGHRRRASSGSQTDGSKKRYTFSMPKSPNLLGGFTFPGWATNDAASGSGSKKPRSYTLMGPASPRPDIESTSSKSASGSNVSTQTRRSTIQNDGAQSPAAQPNVPQQPPPEVIVEKPTPARPPMNRQLTPKSLRRTASDESLVLHRTLSRASSLGDDSRFEHVSEQVNSRLKAIKDSWQDANFKLPGMPSMPSINLTSSLSSSLTDLTRGRAGSLKGASANSTRKATPSPLNLTKATTESVKKSPRIGSGTLGMTPTAAAHHPYFTKAVQELRGDVVILGGYRGSILRSAEPPHRQLWVPIKVGLNLRKVDLEVGLNPEDEETMEERVIPGGMLTHVGPVDVARRLFKRLRASENAVNGELRVHEYSYDWRLSPHLLSRKLIQYLEKLPCNQPGTPKEKSGAIVIAHSLGGLITRHAINQRPELFSGVIYAGTPNTCVNILGPLRNGDDVLLSSRVLTAQVNFTIRTSFALLPLDGKCFFNKDTKEEFDIDFFDPKTWIDHALSPVVATPLPPLKDSTPSGGITGVISSMASALPSLPSLGRKGSIPKSSNNLSEKAKDEKAKATSAAKTANAEARAEGGAAGSGMAPQMGGNSSTGDEYSSSPSNNNTTGSSSNNNNSNPATAVTLPRDAAIAYLTRTLAQVKQFKQELTFRPALGPVASAGGRNAYPPAAVIYGKSIPTVYGAKVASLAHVRHADCYDDLAFASGDGVVLARAAQVPQGYSVVRGGCVSSDRGHVTLLGDLEAVGRCLGAVTGARGAGVGLGVEAAVRNGGGGRERERGRARHARTGTVETVVDGGGDGDGDGGAVPSVRVNGHAAAEAEAGTTEA